ncbi:hypothetical protein ACWGLB_07375 [Streptomyces sp. NPDC055893]
MSGRSGAEEPAQVDVAFEIESEAHDGAGPRTISQFADLIQDALAALDGPRPWHPKRTTAFGENADDHRRGSM